MPKIVSNVIDVYPFRRDRSRAEFLLLKRAPASRLANTWQAVHGHVEADETAWQAALRELEEETGLKPIGFWQIDRVNTFYVAAEDTVLMCPCFAAEIARDDPVRLSCEHSEFRWEDPESAQRICLWPGQRRALREILSEIITPGVAEPHLRIPPQPH